MSLLIVLELLSRLIKEGELLTLYQVHSSKVVIVEEAWLNKNAPKADAAVTSHSGLALGILTADCVPILFADGKSKFRIWSYRRRPCWMARCFRGYC